MAASGELFRYPMDGCLSGCDGVIDQRPYHRNCKCELHKSRKHNCPTGSNAKKGSIVSYPIRRSWSEGCLALSGFSSPASSPGYISPSASTADAGKMNADAGRMKKQLQGSTSDDDDLFPQVNSKNYGFRGS